MCPAGGRCPTRRPRACRAGAAAHSGSSISRARRWPEKVASAISRGASASPIRYTALMPLLRPLPLTLLELRYSSIVRVPPGHQHEGVELHPAMGLVRLARQMPRPPIGALRAVPPDVIHLHPPALDLARKGVVQLLDVQLVQTAHHVRILEREVHVVRQMHPRDDRHLVPREGELLRQARRHEIGVGIQNHHPLADRLLALKHLLGGELIGLRGIGAGDRIVRQAVRAIACSTRSRWQ